MIAGAIIAAALLLALAYCLGRKHETVAQQPKPVTHLELAQRALARVRLDAARDGRIEVVMTVQRMELVLTSIKRRSLRAKDPARL